MDEAPTHVDLASGIGGFSIAAESVGYETIAFYETDPAASLVLDYWWPEVRNHGDLRKICFATRTLLGRVDLLTAGVPCQPASHVGLRRGTSDPRWLWPAVIRVMRRLRPRDAVFENPPALLTLEGGRAFNGIVSELVALGYDLWWDVFPAAAFGAGHLRERLIVVATDSVRPRGQSITREPCEREKEVRRGRHNQQPASVEQDATADSMLSGPRREARLQGRSGELNARMDGAEALREGAADANGERWPETGEQCVLEGAARADDLRRQSASSGRPLPADSDDDAAINDAARVQDSHGQEHRGSSADLLGRRRRKDASYSERAGLQGYLGEQVQRPGASVPRRPVTPPDLRGRVNRVDWWHEAVTGVPVLVNGLPNKLVEAISRCAGNAIVPQSVVPVLAAIHERRMNE